jgi:signal peptidase I
MTTNGPPRYRVDQVPQLSALPLPQRSAPSFARSIGTAIRCTVFLFCLLLLTRAFVVDSYQVPTGSMAPTLPGHHRACVCPRCGYTVRVGLHPLDHGDKPAAPRWYSRAACPNCGATGLALHQVPIVGGQRLVVNKAAALVRSPERWEIIVFRLLGIDLIKRLLGLPGETVEIRDGDLYVDGALCRKTLAEFKAMRILVFDNNYQPHPMTWAARWEVAPAPTGPHPLTGTELHLDASQGADAWQEVAYRHFCLDTHKLLPLVDEYGYNGADPRATTPVHDMMLECDVEVTAGAGVVVFGITDGHDHLLVQIPVTAGEEQKSSAALTLRKVDSFSLLALRQHDDKAVLARSNEVSLRPGKRYHIEVAFVDRRLTLAIDGVQPFAPVDLPECGQRPQLVRPVALAVRGVKALVSNVRLFRDVHYTQAGNNGVGGAVVRLGPDQYFVLGDNSPRSEDSRYWPNGGAVPVANLVGMPAFYFGPRRPR